MSPLSAPVSRAVQAVISWAKDSNRAFHGDSLGSMLLYHYVGARPGEVIAEVRAALGLPVEGRGVLGAWARGKNREKLAEELSALLEPGPPAGL